MVNKKEFFLQAVGLSSVLPKIDNSTMLVPKLGNNITVVLKLAMQQTKHRQTIVKLQPSREDLTPSIDYSIIRDTSGLLGVKRKAGIWGLFFKKRLTEPMKITCWVLGKPRKGPKYSHADDMHAVFRIDIV